MMFVVDININKHDFHDSVVVDVAMMQLCQQCLALTSTLINVNTHDLCDSVFSPRNCVVVVVFAVIVVVSINTNIWHPQ